MQLKHPQVRRRRLPREQRHRLILEEAVRFFAEVGFEGQTRVLAERLGVTQPLLYRYFPDKDSLIDSVFDEVFLKRWKPEWEVMLRDRSRTLLDRLSEFNKAYWRELSSPEPVRIFMFAGLKGEKISQAYLELMRDKVLEPICAELRHEIGLPPPEELPIDEMEIHMAWALQGAIFHIAMRKWIYKVAVPEDIDRLVEYTVRAYLHGSAATLKDMLAARV